MRSESRRPDDAVERARDDEDLALEREAGRARREPGVRVEERDHDRHVGAADGQDRHHAEREPGRAAIRRRPVLLESRLNDKYRIATRRPEEPADVDVVLEFPRDGRAGDDPCSLPKAMRLPVNVKKPRNTSNPSATILNCVR
jgi:hypothetical protein